MGSGTPDMSADPNCIPLATPTISGHHNAGTACLGCHNGGGARQFYAAGTVYDATGKGISGVTIEVSDGANTVRVVSATAPAGNFWIDTPLGPSLKIRASGCPFDRPMAASASGDCNMRGCHDANLRIHVP
jgi:hypothetical protein